MKFAFLGDTAFLEGSEKINFSNIIELLKNTYSVINLESIFEENGKEYKNIKNKISLKQNEKNISILKGLSPFLVNTSNNHSNDCGNIGIDFTHSLLKANKLDYFGSGLKKDQSHIKIYDDKKIIFLSYTTRETDLTGSILWADKENKGPKNLDLNEISKIRSKNKDKKIVVLMHWGYEHQNYPKPDIIKKGKNIIDSGADLIIGSHSHVIQGYQKYKNKYIFYSLGNFILNDIEYSIKGETKKFYQYPRSKSGIIPILDLNNGIFTLDSIYKITRGKTKYKIKKDKLTFYNAFIKLPFLIYKIFFFIYSKINLFKMIYELKIYQKIRKYAEQYTNNSKSTDK